MEKKSISAGSNGYHVKIEEIAIPPLELKGTLQIPSAAGGIVIFVHGSGSSRLSPRNVYVADCLNEAGFATLLFDLLTEREERDRRNVFDIGLLGRRLGSAIDFVRDRKDTGTMPIGLFGASTGAAAALIAAAQRNDVRAVVSRGGRPDLAGDAGLAKVNVPVCLIVGGNDPEVLALNRSALAQITGQSELRIVPGATHLFPEPGALDAVVGHSTGWFRQYLVRPV